MNRYIKSSSKKIGHADDSSATLLKEVIGEESGRNFDIDSLFVERLASGEWRWVVYEFLKAEKIPPKVSHPNYYWNKNFRKFLSLWALIETLRKSGHLADLILLNYSDDRAVDVKEMLVLSVELDPKDVFREAFERNGALMPRIMNHVNTEDSIMSFDAWKERFREFNRSKKGDTWEVLDALK
jgi:hypothetical protein